MNERTDEIPAQILFDSHTLPPFLFGFVIGHIVILYTHAFLTHSQS